MGKKRVVVAMSGTITYTIPEDLEFPEDLDFSDVAEVFDFLYDMEHDYLIDSDIDYENISEQEIVLVKDGDKIIYKK